MKERLIQLLDLEQLSPSKFADIIGVQRSSISHVISGRNKPSFDFLQKTLKAFPGLNASWLMLGEGSMYEQMGRNVSGNLFDSPAAPEEHTEGHIPVKDDVNAGISPANETISAAADTEKEPDPPVSDEHDDVPELKVPVKEIVRISKKRIVQVMVIYEDDTFRAFTPAN